MGVAEFEFFLNECVREFRIMIGIMFLYRMDLAKKMVGRAMLYWKNECCSEFEETVLVEKFQEAYLEYLKEFNGKAG